MAVEIGKCRASRPGERGVALIVALLAMTLLSGLGAGLLLVSTTEMRVASAHHHGDSGFYAAEAGLEMAMAGLRAAMSPTAVLAGAERSALSDGEPVGRRSLPGGVELDLDTLTNRLRCGRPRTCTEAEMDAVTPGRAWGANNPRWQPYLYGPVAGLVGSTVLTTSAYVVVWVADDPLEDDADPLVDDPDEGHPGHGVLRLHAEAFTNGRRRALEATVARVPRGLLVHSWKELR